MRRPVSTCLTAAIVVLSVAGASACGLPSDGESRPIDPTSVPYALLSPAPSDQASSPAGASRVATPRVYLLDRNDKLVGVPAAAPVPVPTTRTLGSELGRLLAMLAGGPTELERNRGLATALGPNVTIDLLRVENGTAYVDVHSAGQDPTANRIPLAVGQVVLTATSVTGIDAVQLERSGQAVSVPLPGGALTTQPLRRADYASLLRDA